VSTFLLCSSENVLNLYALLLVFERCKVRISVRSLTALGDICHDFHISLEPEADG
jgi:hypothetical protein